jgi:septum formation inhibitor-activating ATPase MinD
VFAAIAARGFDRARFPIPAVGRGFQNAMQSASRFGGLIVVQKRVGAIKQRGRIVGRDLQSARVKRQRVI